MSAASLLVPWRPAPWNRHALFWPLRPATRGFDAQLDWPAIAQYRALLGGECPVDFCPAAPRARGRRRALRRAEDRPYDAVIVERGAVPTRPRSWHDLFNALVWATFPSTKMALHRRQLRARARVAHGAGRRTREQDGLALLDEGGVALLCEQASLADASAALDARDGVAISQLVARGAALGVVYGHAIYEQLACGGPPVRALVHLAACSPLPEHASSCTALADEALSDALANETSFTDPETLRSLPATTEVLGARP